MTGLIWELPLFIENLKDVKCTYQKAKDTLKKLRNSHFNSCYYHSQKKKSWTNVLRFKQRNLSTAVPFLKGNGGFLAISTFRCSVVLATLGYMLFTNPAGIKMRQ